MKTIKIIDLLNKIANREEVPKKIRFHGDIFKFTGYNSVSKNYVNDLEDLFEVLDGSMLNDEVEILEEEKKIPEKIFLEDMYVPSEVKAIDMELENKINEIIDYLKSKGE